MMMLRVHHAFFVNFFARRCILVPAAVAYLKFNF